MKIPLFKNFSDQVDIDCLSAIIKSGQDWAIGPNIINLEKNIADYLNVKHVLLFNSGTSALHALMIATGLKNGDEVIVPSFSFIATANAPLFVKAKPVFADIEEETYGLDPQDVLKKITPRTKAIIPVHYGGQSCQIVELKKIAKKNKLLLLEDAAESLGATFNNKLVGSFGDASIFSFCGPKIISTGEGGALVTNNHSIFKKALLIRSHGRLDKINYFTSTDRPEYISLGFNWRISNISATLGISQFKKIKQIIDLRQKNSAYLSSNLSSISEITLPIVSPHRQHLFQMYTIRVIAGQKKREALRKFLNQSGISAKVYFHPIHLTSFYKKNDYQKTILPVTEKISSQVLTLPMYPNLNKTELDYIIKKIKQFFNK